MKPSASALFAIIQSMKNQQPNSSKRVQTKQDQTKRAQTKQLDTELTLNKQLEQFLSERRQPDFRTEQFFKHYYQHLITDFEQITTWSKDLRLALSQEIEFSTLKVKKQQVSKGQETVKVLFSLKRQPTAQVEAVLLRFQDGRNSVCVSCMAGCPLGCQFCATGQMGLQAKLTSREIVDQVLFFARLLKEEHQKNNSQATKPPKITHVVYMGMGEPMLNLGPVLSSVKVLTDLKKFGLSKRRLTISTAGHLPGLKKFIQQGYIANLAVSLHVPNQALRAKLMPVAKLYPLEQLMAVLTEYVQLTNKQITYEYLLLKEVNDQPKQALELAKLLRDRLAHVNLIAYNQVPGSAFQAPQEKTIKEFSQILADQGISNTIRVSLGQDIKAACGQLAS